MRKISIVNNVFSKYGDTPDSFEKMAACGFTACDYSILSDIRNDLYCDGVRQTILNKVRISAKKAGVELYQAHGPWVWPTGNETPEGREHWHKCMITALENCNILECKNLVVHPVMPFGATSATDPDAFVKINFDFWQSLMPYAEKYGVRILLENMPFLQMVVSSPQSTYDFVQSMDNPYFAMCYDTGHGLVWNEDIGKSIKLASDKIYAFHVHDNDTKSDQHLCPMFGKAHWQGFKEALRTVDESVPLSLECGTAGLTGELADTYLAFLAKVASYLAN